jgi:hypothetical protein
MSDNPLEDSPERDQRIRERAYHLWEADGSPHGRDMEYWERARELVGIEDSAGAGEIPAASISDDDVVDEAALQDNLGEFPGLQKDQGDERLTPMTRQQMRATST